MTVSQRNFVFLFWIILKKVFLLKVIADFDALQKWRATDNSVV